MWRLTEYFNVSSRDEAFATAQLPAFAPRAFRHMYARHVVTACNLVAEVAAASQDLVRSEVLTTLRSCGQISRERQRALFAGESEDDARKD